MQSTCNRDMVRPLRQIGHETLGRVYIKIPLTMGKPGRLQYFVFPLSSRYRILQSPYNRDVMMITTETEVFDFSDGEIYSGVELTS